MKWIELLVNIAPYENGVKKHYGAGSVIEVSDGDAAQYIGAGQAKASSKPVPPEKKKRPRDRKFPHPGKDRS